MEKIKEKGALSFFFILFLFYIIVWWLQLGQRLGNRFGVNLRLEAYVAVILLIYTAVDTFRRNEDQKSGLSLFVGALFAIMLFQVITAWNIDKAWYIFTERVLKYSAMALFICRFVRTPTQMKWLMFAWLLACWKGTSEGFIGGITGSLVWENQGIPRLHGNGLWSHPNSFSEFALGTIPYCFYLFPLLTQKWKKIGILSLFIFSTYVVIYTGSRTGYLGYLIMLILFFFQSSKIVRKRLIIIIIILTPVTIAFMPKAYQERFLSSFSGKEKEGASKQARLKLYREGWFVIKKHPFGVGVGNYPEAGKKYFGYTQEQHCLYTEVFTELGIQGLIVFLAFIWKIYSVLKDIKIRLRKILKKLDEYNYPNINDIRFLYGVVQSTQLYFLLRLFLDIFGMDLYGIVWWFTIGITSSTYLILNEIEIMIEKK